MVKTDRIVALTVIGISLCLFAQTGKFLEEDTGEPISAAFFPRIILTALIFCCIWLALKTKMETISFPAPKGVMLGVIQVIVYVMLIKPVGYFIITPLFLFLLPASLGYRKWGWLAIIASGGTLFSWIVFLKVLGVPLPMGIFE